MKKIIFLLFILLIPFYVFAEDDDIEEFVEDNTPKIITYTDRVSVESIEVIETSSDDVSIKDIEADGLLINLDIEFLELNDYAKFKIVINNPTDTDYEISKENIFSKSDYITYEYKYEGTKGMVPKNSKTILYITIKYNNKIPTEQMSNGFFQENNSLVINLGNETVNPVTKDYIIITIALFTITLFLIVINKKKLAALTCLCMFVPLSVMALEQLKIDLNTKVTINDNRVFYLYHTSDNTIETYEYYGNKNGINVIELVKDGYLYGGVSLDYLGMGSYEGNGIPAPDATPYLGTEEEKMFSRSQVEKGKNWNGFSLIPEPGVTYFLKEVPESYFSQIRANTIFNTSSHVITSFSLFSFSDDTIYRTTGMMINDEMRRGAFAKTFTLMQNNGPTESFTSETLFGKENGYLVICILDPEEYIGTYDIYPFYVTYDKVKVEAKNGKRMTKTGNKREDVSFEDISRDNYVISLYEG